MEVRACQHCHDYIVTAPRQGVPLSANTLAKASGRAIDLLDPIVQHIFHQAMISEYFGFDATSIRVLDSQHTLGIRTGALWLLQGDHRDSYFMYADSGHARHLEALLKGYKLASVMCDGAATNNCVERHGATRGGCNSHARRNLVDALRNGDMRALEGRTVRAHLSCRCRVQTRSRNRRTALRSSATRSRTVHAAVEGVGRRAAP
jgi:hypothetical protein